MTAPTPDLFVYLTPHDLAAGVARRVCPYCSGPLVVKLPSLADAVRAQESHALRLGFDELTPTERELFDFVYGFWPRAVSSQTVVKALDDISRESLRQHVKRLRDKLKTHDWLLVGWHSSLRLVEPVPIV